MVRELQCPPIGIYTYTHSEIRRGAGWLCGSRTQVECVRPAWDGLHFLRQQDVRRVVEPKSCLDVPNIASEAHLTVSSAANLDQIVFSLFAPRVE